jgi:ectoine hydroxylase-related dioxygenase (phytanoyl-CoA dioxygenase family)
MNTSPLITEQQKDLYRREGYMLLPGVIPADMLTMMREECSYFLGYCDSRMDAAGKQVDDLNHRGRRYFINNRYRLSSRMWQFIFSPLMAEVAQAALGPNVYLFHEQWVIKGAEQGMKFAWHQDSGYVDSLGKTKPHKPYLTCWCPLDDVDEKNGTVYLLPHSRGGTNHTVFNHQRESGSNDLVGYSGTDPGDALNLPAGSIAAFTSYNLHRSGANTTKNMRRVYLPQYSCEPIVYLDGRNLALTVPFVIDGKIVYNHADDTPDKYGPPSA